MFAKQCVTWLARLVLAAATLLADVDAARADAWSWLNGCGCGCSEQLPAAQVESPPTSCLTRPFWMRPTPPYNSSWASVPVTNYRPQAVIDPLSGASFTALQPCHTTEWQLRRTPGCSLWQSLSNWWQSRCCLLHPPRMSPATTTCTPTNEWVVSSSEPTASPYYATPTNGRLVPVPSSVSPTSPVPADRRPQLDPIPARPSGEGSASRLFPPDTEVPATDVFVYSLDDSAASVEFGPPLVAPLSQAADSNVADDQAASIDETSLELIPVGLSIATPLYESKLPTDVVWDDTGWQSEQ